MNIRTNHGRWIKITATLLPAATVILFGLSGGWFHMNSWISGAAIGWVEAALLLFLYRIPFNRKASISLPFRIALGFVTGMYAMIAIIEVICFGYLFKVSGWTYLSIHIITFIVFSMTLGIVSRAGKYAGDQERTENRLLSAKRETTAWITSIRKQILAIPDVPEQEHLLAETKELEESLRYSDPVFIASLSEMNHLIQQKISILEDQVKLIAAVPDHQRKELAQEAVLLVKDTLKTVNERRTAWSQGNTGTT
ncbi:hypothetical protein GRF59_11790 [Paenibacillus sp. HJL G12]|uniref:Uncharacterized protein n=1 Tax=Paenibacillus dendrobii TaxID=2691084 RepID=A0A7X3ILM1_9BACL|nr:hypothetical protein [Paenibacillus dendrobii]MWV44312.1 hypothetical protein [Paenibacillus dendrobii]